MDRALSGQQRQQQLPCPDRVLAGEPLENARERCLPRRGAPLGGHHGLGDGRSIDRRVRRLLAQAQQCRLQAFRLHRPWRPLAHVRSRHGRRLRDRGAHGVELSTQLCDRLIGTRDTRGRLLQLARKGRRARLRACTSRCLALHSGA